MQNLAVKGILGVICEKREEGFPSNRGNQEGFGGTGDWSEQNRISREVYPGIVKGDNNDLDHV